MRIGEGKTKVIPTSLLVQGTAIIETTSRCLRHGMATWQFLLSDGNVPINDQMTRELR